MSLLRHKIRKIRVKANQPKTLPSCYSKYSAGKEQCGICKYKKFCNEARDIPLLTYETDYSDMFSPLGAVVNDKFTGYFAKDMKFEYFDDPSSERKKVYTRTDMLYAMVYLLSLGLKQFCVLKAKVFQPHISPQALANCECISRAGISKRIVEIIKARPELFPVLRIHRRVNRQGTMINGKAKRRAQ